MSRISLLSIILLVSINLLISITIADTVESKYKNERFQTLQLKQKSLYLDIENIEVKSILAQSELVWRKTLILNLGRGFVLIGIYSAFLFIFLWVNKRKHKKSH